MTSDVLHFSLLSCHWSIFFSDVFKDLVFLKILKFFCFELTMDSWVRRNVWGGSSAGGSLLPVSPSVDILYHCSTWSKPGNWHWHKTYSSFRFLQSHTHSFVCVGGEGWKILVYAITTRLPTHCPCVPTLASCAPPHPSPWATANLFFVSITMWFHKCYINCITQYAPFWDWLLSLSKISLTIIQVVTYFNSSLFFYCYVVFHGMDVPHFVQPLTQGRKSALFPGLAVTDNAAVNIHSCTRFCMKTSFHFHGIEIQEYNC